MNILTVDFETYYDKEYSLRKMTTEAYIRDSRFEIIGVAVKLNNGPVEFYYGDDMRGFLAQFDWRNSAVLCHNTAFDGAILSWLFDIKPKLWLDTMSMAKPFHGQTCGVSLDALSKEYKLGHKGEAVKNMLGKRRKDMTKAELLEYALYCAGDASLTYALFNKLKGIIPKSELAIIDQTIRMYTEPMFELDKPLLESHLINVREKKKRLIDAITTPDPTQDTKSVLMSNDKFAELLRQLGVDPPTKISPATQKITYAFSKSDLDFTALQEHENPLVQAAVAARLGVKSTLEETRTEAFIGVASRGRLPIMLKYWGAHTGRFSGGDKLNLQNLNRGGVLRKSLRAPPGKVVITCDASQIEARLVAWLARQSDLVAAFAEQRDVYSEFATDVYGRPVSKTDKLERFVGKTCILGLGYGMGASKFQRTLAIGQGGISVKLDEYESNRIVDLYRRKNHKIKGFWYRCGDALMQMSAGNSGQLLDHIDIQYQPDRIILPTGLPIMYPQLHGTGSGFKYISSNKPAYVYGGKMVENITQALAQAFIKEVMIKLRHVYPVVLQVHDEVVLIVSERDADAAKQFIIELMSTPPVWAPDLPVACEAGVGPSYGEAK